MLGIPFGIDQFLNLRRAVNDGYALQLQWKEINENTLSSAIQQLLFNEWYNLLCEFRNEQMAVLF